MAVSTESTTPLKSTKSKNSNLQVQIKPESQFEFVLRDTEESEILDLVDSGGVAFSVETFMSIACFVLCIAVIPGGCGW